MLLTPLRGPKAMWPSRETNRARIPTGSRSHAPYAFIRRQVTNQADFSP